MSRGYAPHAHLVALSAQGHDLESRAEALLAPDELREVRTRRHLGYGHSGRWARIRKIQRPEVQALCRQADAIWWTLARSHERVVMGRASFYAQKMGYDPAEVMGWAWLGAYAGARRWRPYSGSLCAAIKSWVRNWVLVSAAEERGDLSGAGHSRVVAGRAHALRLDQPLRAGEPDLTLLDVVGVEARQLEQVEAAELIQQGLERCSPRQRADLLATAEGWEGTEIAAQRGVSKQSVNDNIMEGRRRMAGVSGGRNASAGSPGSIVAPSGADPGMDLFLW